MHKTKLRIKKNPAARREETTFAFDFSLICRKTRKKPKKLIRSQFKKAQIPFS
jgi:hypothetical protein